MQICDNFFFFENLKIWKKNLDCLPDFQPPNYDFFGPKNLSIFCHRCKYVTIFFFFENLKIWIFFLDFLPDFQPPKYDFFGPKNLSIFCHRCIRKTLNSLPLCRKIASQFSSSAYVRIIHYRPQFASYLRGWNKVSHHIWRGSN
jgi:hypothetical protein